MRKKGENPTSIARLPLAPGTVSVGTISTGAHKQAVKPQIFRQNQGKIDPERSGLFGSGLIGAVLLRVGADWGRLAKPPIQFPKIKSPKSTERPNLMRVIIMKRMLMHVPRMSRCQDSSDARTKKEQETITRRTLSGAKKARQEIHKESWSPQDPPPLEILYVGFFL